MNVEFIDAMGDDLRVANVARCSFNKWKDKLEESDVSLIRYLYAHNHNSPFRHVQLTLRVEAPIPIARQFGKHQIGMSWNEVSRRYVNYPVSFHNQEFRFRPDASIKQGSGGVAKLTDVPLVRVGDHLFSVHEVQAGLKGWYNDAVDSNIGNLAPETVRGYIPQNMLTQWIWTGSLESFFHVYKLRIDGHAQKEAQQLAEMIGVICEQKFPECWKVFKSGCFKAETEL